MLTSKVMRYFEEVARRGSIRSASEHLHIAASAIDRQIIQLEEHLGVPLFDRNPKGLTLTTAGEVLIEATRKANRNLNDARRHISDLQGLRRGEILIAGVEGMHGIINGPLAAFQLEFPNISQRVQITDAAHVAQLVMANECDIGLTFTSSNSQVLRVERQMLMQFEAVVSPEHAQAKSEQISVHDCDEYPLVLPAQPLSLRGSIDEFWHKYTGSLPSPVFESNSVALLKSMISTTGAMGILTPVDVASEVREGTLVSIPLKEVSPVRVLSLVTSSSRTMSRGALELLKRISQEMARQNQPVI